MTCGEADGDPLAWISCDHCSKCAADPVLPKGGICSLERACQLTQLTATLLSSTWTRQWWTHSNTSASIWKYATAAGGTTERASVLMPAGSRSWRADPGSATRARLLAGEKPCARAVRG